MLFSTSYKMILDNSSDLYKMKGSKFYAFAFPVRTETEIKSHLNALKEKYPDASHHCYGWVLGYDKQNFRANDDGEPSNTAGKPILRQIQKLDLSNILVVVVRYFGGTLLGVPGLIEAYGNAAQACLSISTIETFPILEIYHINCSFGTENEVYRICKQYHCSISVLNEAKCFSAEIKIPLHEVQAFKQQIDLNYQLSLEYIGVE